MQQVWGSPAGNPFKLAYSLPHTCCSKFGVCQQATFFGYLSPWFLFFSCIYVPAAVNFYLFKGFIITTPFQSHISLRRHAAIYLSHHYLRNQPSWSWGMQTHPLLIGQPHSSTLWQVILYGIISFPFNVHTYISIYLQDQPCRALGFRYSSLRSLLRDIYGIGFIITMMTPFMLIVRHILAIHLLPHYLGKMYVIAHSTAW